MLSQIDKPQVVIHSQKNLAFTAYDVKWLPKSTKFVCIGQNARGTGALNVHSLSNGSITTVKEVEKTQAFKCGTFGAAGLNVRHFATGDFEGRMNIWDLDALEYPIYNVKAHEQIVNCIDGCGGNGQYGPPEIVTGGRDGMVQVWDVRQKDKPVATMAPAPGQAACDTWAVAFGNSYDDTERCVAAGYENGDVKIFDLKAMKTVWETNVKNGVCSLEFDRKDIKMNKLVVGGLESKMNVFDCRTLSSQGFAATTVKGNDTTTIWTVKHLPQNRDVFMSSGGSGGLSLYMYQYPERRSKMDVKTKEEIGVAGTCQLLNTATVADQPIGAFDWSPDKLGLFTFVGYDQAIRIGLVTRLNSLK